MLKTRYDLLKEMTAEQLVCFFVNEGGCPPSGKRPENCYQQSCVCCWLKYLFEEVKDDAEDPAET